MTRDEFYFTALEVVAAIKSLSITDRNRVNKVAVIKSKFDKKYGVDVTEAFRKTFKEGSSNGNIIARYITEEWMENNG